MSRNSVPMGHDTRSSSMKMANAAGRHFTEHADKRVDAAYRKGLNAALQIVRTADTLRNAAQCIEEAARKSRRR